MTAVTVVGTGAIGATVAAALARGAVPGCTLVAAVNSRTDLKSVFAAVASSDVVVEASTVEAARTVIPMAISAGKDVVVCSCGVLAEPVVMLPLSSGGRVLLPSGAIGGFDTLAAAVCADSTDAQVRHVTVKSPAALGADAGVDGPVEVFRGSAREAALRFPRTSNSSVALALATVGLDRVEVVIVADPAASSTTHRVQWISAVGTYEFSFQNTVDHSSGGQTSAITAWSVMATLAGLHNGVGPGVVVLDGCTPALTSVDGQGA
jgi:aspartate dehydrogenase